MVVVVTLASCLFSYADCDVANSFAEARGREDIGHIYKGIDIMSSVSMLYNNVVESNEAPF